MKIVQTRLGNIFSGAGPVQFKIEDCAAAIHWNVRDHHGSTIDQGEAPAGTTELSLPSSRVGYFELDLSTDDGDATHTPFAVIASHDFGPKSDPRFGVCSHFGQWWKSEIIPIMALAGVGEARDEMYWEGLEKERGVFTFPEKEQEYLDRLCEHNISLHLGLTYGNSFYDDGKAPHTDEGYRAYARYANAVLDRFPEQIRTVEIWNEWNAGFGGGPAAASPEIYHALLATAYREIKRRHPEVTVVGCSITGLWWGGYSWFSRFLKLPGALELMDALSMHPYKCELEPEYLTESMAKLNAMMRDAGGPVQPLWATELGWPINVHPQAVADQAYESLDVRTSEEAQARYLVRSHVLLLAAGVERIHWYDFMNDGTDSRNGEHNFGMIRHPDDANGPCTPMPAYAAYAAMTRELAGAAFVRQEQASASLQSFAFRRDGADVRVAWSLEPAALRVRARGSFTAVDLMGNERAIEPRGEFALLSVRSGEPVYLRGPVEGITIGAKVVLDDTATVCVGETIQIPYHLDSDLPDPLPIELEMAGARHSRNAEGMMGCDGSFELPAISEAGTSIIPCIIKIDGALVAERPVEIQVRPLVDIPHPPVFVDDSTLRVTLRNASRDTALRVSRVRGSGSGSGGSISSERKITFTLAPGEKADVDLANVCVEPYAMVAFQIEVELADGSIHEWSGHVGNNPVHRLTPVLDGRFDEWEALPAIDLEKHGKLRMKREYKGAADLSGKIWLAYDDKNFYLAARIADDIHYPPLYENGSGDLIDFIVAPYTPWDGAAQRVWPGEGFWRFTLSLRSGGPQVFQWKGVNEDEGQSLAVGSVCRAERRGNETLYEAAISREGRDLFATDSPYFSCSLLVNDPDGPDARGWIEWGSGFAEGKRRNLFNLCRLAGTSAPRRG